MVAGEAARASSPPAPKVQAGPRPGGEEAPRAEQQQDEGAFEDALTDEQLREVGRYLPDRRRFVPRREVRVGEGSRRGEGRRRRPAGSRQGEGGGGGEERGDGEERERERVRVRGGGRGLLQKCFAGAFHKTTKFSFFLDFVSK